MSNLNNEIEEVLVTEEEIESKVREIAKKITKDYRGLSKDSTPRKLLTIGILRGSVMFLADLTRKIRLPLAYDFIALTSYGDSSVPGRLKLTKDLEHSIEGKDVLIIEDIVDTGKTLTYIKDLLKQRAPRSLKIAALIDKTPRREVEPKLDYVGFTIQQDKFLVGYGLDYAEKYRNLPYIASLKAEVLEL